MRSLAACSILTALLLVAVLSPQSDAQPPVAYHQSGLHHDPWFVCHGPCTRVLTDAIGLARKSVFIEGYRIGPRPVLNALRQAEAAGVRVGMVTERGRTRYQGSAVAQDSRVVPDPNYALDRPEVMVIDKRQVVKVFFASSPTHSREVASVFVIRDRNLARAYSLRATQIPR